MTDNPGDLCNLPRTFSFGRSPTTALLFRMGKSNRIGKRTVQSETGEWKAAQENNCCYAELEDKSDEIIARSKAKLKFATPDAICRHTLA